jgi:alkylation response protein AidB-like acyl-CoA dehydrogenase
MKSKIKYLVPCKGEVIGAFCLSEPEAGSDATSKKRQQSIKEIIY